MLPSCKLCLTRGKGRQSIFDIDGERLSASMAPVELRVRQGALSFLGAPPVGVLSHMHEHIMRRGKKPSSP